MAYCENYRTWLWLPTKRSFVIIVVTWGIFFVVQSNRSGKTFRESTFALHRQKPDKDQQKADVSPPEKISADAHANS